MSRFKHQKGFVIIPILFFIVALLALSYFVIKNNIKRSYPNGNEQPMDSSKDSVTVSPLISIVPRKQSYSCEEGSTKIVGDFCQATVIECKEGVLPSKLITYPKDWNALPHGGPGGTGFKLSDVNDVYIMDIYSEHTQYNLDEIYKMLEDKKNIEVYNPRFAILDPRTIIADKKYLTVGGKNGINLITKLNYENGKEVNERIFLFKPKGYDTIIKVSISAPQEEMYKVDIEKVIESIKYLDEVNPDC